MSVGEGGIEGQTEGRNCEQCIVSEAYRGFCSRQRDPWVRHSVVSPNAVPGITPTVCVPCMCYRFILLNASGIDLDQVGGLAGTLQQTWFPYSLGYLKTKQGYICYRITPTFQRNYSPPPRIRVQRSY